MVLINNNFDQKVENFKTDVNGNFILLDMKIQGTKVTLINLYGPNEDNPQFYRTLKEKYSEYENDFLIICGDWNLVLNPEIDTFNYRHTNNPKARQIVSNLMDEDDLIDIWRIMNEDKKCFTWSRKRPERKQARLDFFLVTDMLLAFVTDTKIIPGYRTDHSAIVLEFSFQNNDRGKGYWKFNNSLLKDKNYIALVKETIDEVKNTYKTNNIQDNQTTNENIKFDINDQLFLETLLMIIRGNTIKYSAFRKKQTYETEKKLENDIKVLEDKVNKDFSNINEQILDELAQKKGSLAELRSERI